MDLYKNEDSQAVDEAMRGIEVIIIRFCATLNKLKLMSKYELERIESKVIYGVDMPPAQRLY